MDIFELRNYMGEGVVFTRYLKDNGEYTKLSGVISGVKSHKQRVNLSVLLSEFTEVDLDNRALLFGLPKVFDAVKYHQASVVRDGEIGDFAFTMGDVMIDSGGIDYEVKYKDGDEDSLLEYIAEIHGVVKVNSFLKELMIYAMADVGDEYGESLSQNAVDYLKEFNISADGVLYGGRKAHKKVSKKVRIVEVDSPFKIPSQKDIHNSMMNYPDNIRVLSGYLINRYVDEIKRDKMHMIMRISTLTDSISHGVTELTKSRIAVHKFPELFGEKFKKEIVFTKDQSQFEQIEFPVTINVTEKSFSV